MSTLAQQLKTKIQYVGGVNMAKATSRPSYLFDPKKAADMDNDTIYQIGHAGYLALSALDPAVGEAGAYFFDDSVRNLDRVHLTAAETRKLDERVDLFMRRLCPHILVSHTGNVLEWMVRRFRVNDFNVEALLRAFVPYHHTQQFVRLAMVVTLKSDLGNDQFPFLGTVRSQQIPLEMATLTRFTRTNRELLQIFSADLLWHAQHSTSVPRVLTTFVLNYYLSYLADQAVLTDNLLRFLFPMVFNLIAAPAEDCALVAYAVLTHVAHRVPFSDALLDRALRAVLGSNGRRKAPVPAVLLTLLQLLQAGAESAWAMDTAFLTQFVTLPDLHTALRQLSRKYNTDPLVGVYLRALVDHADARKENLTDLAAYLLDAPVPDVLVREVTEALLTRLTDPSETATIDAEAAYVVLRQVHQNQAALFDAVVANAYEQLPPTNDATRTVRETALNDHLQACLASGRFMTLDGIPLYVGLHHPSSTIRLLAFRVLASMTEETEVSDDLDAFLLDGLLDESPEIISEVLDHPRLVAVRDSAQLVANLAILISRAGALTATSLEALARFLFVTAAAAKPQMVEVELASALLSTFLYGITPERTIAAFLNGLKAGPLATAPLFAPFYQAAEASLDNDTQDRFAAYHARALALLSEALQAHPTLVGVFEGMLKAAAPESRCLALVVLSRYHHLNGNPVAAHTFLGTVYRGLQVHFRTYKATSKVVLAHFLHSEDGLPVRARLTSRKVAKWTNPATPAAFLAFALLNTLEGLQADTELDVVSWFTLHGASNPIVTAPTCFHGQILGALLLALASPDAAFRDAVVQTLVTCHLGDQLLPLLASVWSVRSYYPTSLRLAALQLAEAYVAAGLQSIPQGTVRDYQLLLPSLLVVLDDADTLLRRKALEVIAQLVETNTKVTYQSGEDIMAAVVQAGSFFGPATAEVAYVDPVALAWLVKLVNSHAGQLLAGTMTVRDVLALPVEGKRARARSAQCHGFLFSAARAQALTPGLPVYLTLLATCPLPLEGFSLPEFARAMLEAVVDQPAAEDFLNAGLGVLIRDILPRCIALGRTDTELWSELLTVARHAMEEHQALVADLFTAITTDVFELLTDDDRRLWFAFVMDVPLTSSPAVYRLWLDRVAHYAFDSALVVRHLTSIHDTLCHPTGDQEDSQVASSATGGKRKSAAAGPADKRGRAAPAEPAADRALRHLGGALDLLNVNGALARDISLTPRLFDLLPDLLAFPSAHPPLSLDYLRQRLMAVLDVAFCSLTDRTDAEIAVFHNTGAVRPDALVACLRATRNAQTHRAVLQLLGTMAAAFPEEVLHHCMPVFTFMGVSTLGADDTYTFEVITGTLRRILTALAARVAWDPTAAPVDFAAGSSVGTLVKTVPAALVAPLRVLVDAWGHIPAHRRSAIFGTVATCLGPDTFVAVLWTLLVERAAMRAAEPDATVLAFAVELAGTFSAHVQLRAASALLAYLRGFPSPTRTPAKATPALFEGQRPLSSRATATYHLAALQLVDGLAHSEHLLARIAEADADAHDDLLDDIQSLTRLLLELHARMVPWLQVPGALSLWSDVDVALRTALVDLQHFMDLPLFARIAGELLGHADPVVRHEGLLMVLQKLEPLARNVAYRTAEAGQKVLLPLLPSLLNAAGRAEEAGPHAAVPASRSVQVVIANVSALAILLAADYPAAFLHSVGSIAGSGGLGSSDLHVFASSCACLVHLFRHLGVRTLIALKSTLSIVLARAGALTDELTDLPTGDTALALVSALRLLEELVVRLPKFTIASAGGLIALLFRPAFWPQPEALRRLRTVAQARADGSAGDNDAMDEDDSDDEATGAVASTRPRDPATRDLLERVQALVTATARTFDPSTYLPALYSAHAAAVRQPIHVTVAYVDAVALCLQQASSAVHRGLYADSVDFLLRLLDYRQAATPASRTLSADQARVLTVEWTRPLAAVDVVEDRSVVAFVQFALKLNEMMFKPLFVRVVAWAVDTPDSADPTARRVTLFKLLGALLERLRTIASPYYTHVLDRTLEVLECFPVQNVDPASFAPSTPLDTRVLTAAAAASSVDLWRHAMRSLTLVFQFDKGEFCRPAVFDQVLGPLVRQIPRLAYCRARDETGTADQMATDSDSDSDDLDEADNAAIIPPSLMAVYQKRIEEVVSPCLNRLAEQYRGEAQWKALNHQVLLLTRNPNPCVRVAALLVTQGLYRTLKEELLIHLPETIPFLYEVIEDEDPWVEKTAQQTVQLIEEYLGEPLKKYFE
ncbi:snoRNA-binding rRNA-processing protein utp10 [Tieghemiomyces parasiticus]|uniref:U3 small nucleolar RNA-associated protein 10 n=1 Tax=Tieghemiomyces parasiticus TaxID=78921 RepID=A0A9W8AD87_9FUNG|nr:snoRNA-binding rRNA-processing protein utp10 [Tieghemiomyces parasiticus]